MPEILTKHPEVVIKVLKSEGAQCGTGAKPKILTKCPPDQFCRLAGGELCVFGSDELGKMTQLAPSDVCSTAGGPTSSRELVPPPRSVSQGNPVVTGAMPIALAIVAVGFVALLRRSR